MCCTELLRKSWIDDCNKTVSLTKEHPRAGIWSPSFPRQYPDNANCYTTITAPTGYRIVIEFEELVIENEPGLVTNRLKSLNYKTYKSFCQLFLRLHRNYRADKL